MSVQIPTMGRIVHYRLSAGEAETINKRRSSIKSSNGDDIHRGNAVSAGDTFPLIITRVWGSEPDSYVNGQVMLDGNDLFWATSVKVGDGERTYSWPSRA